MCVDSRGSAYAILLGTTRFEAIRIKAVRAIPDRPGRAEGMEHDAIVIGAGPTGLAAAIEGTTRGLDVLLVDDGTLTLKGVLSAYALDFHQLRWTALEMLRDGGQQTGGAREETRQRWSQAVARARRIASAELARQWEQLASIGVSVERGPARIAAPGRIVLGGGAEHRARILILACACRPRRPARFPWRGGVFQDPVSIWNVDAPPRSALVIGAEEAGCETASLLAAMGSEVTLLDRRRRTLRYVDRELTELFYSELDSRGVEIALGETIGSVREVESEDPHAIVELGSGSVRRWDTVVVAAGRVPDLSGIELEPAGIALCSDGRVTIDELHRTNVDGIYAAGEAAAGRLQWKALPQEGREAMGHALGLDAAARPIPIGIHSIPEIAMVGFSAEMCARLDIAHEVGTARYDELPPAKIRGERGGMLKLVVDRSSRCLLGAHAVGADAHELIQRAVTALRFEETVEELAYGAVSPSLSEAYVLAADRCRRSLGAPALARTDSRGRDGDEAEAPAAGSAKTA